MIAGRPRVLIVDDDAVSLCFFATAVAELGAEPVTAADAAAALAAARGGAPSLLVIDRRLGDTDGADLLRRLRARGCAAPAIATSAELDAHAVAALRAAGFAATLLKPASVAAVQAAVARQLPELESARPAAAAAPAVARPGEPLLDDAAALVAIGGDRGALAGLRRLLLGELENLSAQLDGAPVARETMRPRLHRLRASCGFCGAAALGAAAAELDRQFAVTEQPGAPALATFLQTCRDTVDALRTCDGCSVAPP